MYDRVAEVLAQRASLESGAGKAVVVSLVMHGAITAAALWAALHHAPPQTATMVSIKLAPMSQPSAPPARPAARRTTPRAKPVEQKKPETPKIEQQTPQPVKPVPVAAAPEKNTVPLSPFGRSTRRGSETPAPPPPVAATPAPVEAPGALTTTDVPVGGSGIAGLEGGDFPYTIYIDAMHRRIGSNWFRPAVPNGTAVVIYYRIQRDGKITDAKVDTPSGNGTFDRAALSAVRSSSPLNPLPFGYNGTYLGVRLVFR